MASTQIRPIILTRTGRQNEPLRVALSPLLVDPLAYSIMTTDTSSGSSTIVLKNASPFTSTNAYVLIGPLGNQGAEIIQISSISGNTLTLSTTTTYAHQASTPVYQIAFNQIIIESSATQVTNGTIPTGTTSVLGATAINANQIEYITNDTTTATGFYYARYRNSAGGTFSMYSDGMPVAGYGPLTARRITNNALDAINKKTSDVLTDEFAFNEINNCQMECLREYKRWSFMEVLNYSLGISTIGGWTFKFPPNLDDQNTNKSVYGFRFGKRANLTFVDKEKWNELLFNVAYSSLSSALAVGDNAIFLSNSSDFASTGSVFFAGTTTSYITNSVVGNALVVGGASSAAAVGTPIFQGAAIGEPQYWTDFFSSFFVYPVIGPTVAPATAYTDYYKTLIQIVNDADTIVLPDPLVVQYYLEWKMLKRLNNGLEDEASRSAFERYIERREKMKQKETLGTSYVLKPRLNDFSRQMRGLGGNEDTRRVRGGNFPNI